MTDQIAELVSRLQSEWPAARVGVDTFPSGAFFLDVVCAERHFLLRYFPASGEYGVDEVLPDEGFLEKYALVTPDRNAAVDFLRGLVNAAHAPFNGTPPTATARNTAS